MGKPIEQRMGGPNSIASMREMGLVVDGSHQDVTVRPHPNNPEKFIQVRPVIIDDNTAGSGPVKFTIFQPSKSVMSELIESKGGD